MMIVINGLTIMSMFMHVDNDDDDVGDDDDE